MIISAISISQVEFLNMRAEAHCQRYAAFDRYVQSNSSVGKVCTFVNLVKYLLDKYLDIGVDDCFVKMHGGIYAFTFRVIANLDRIYRRIDQIQMDELRVIIRWTYHWQDYWLPH